VITEKEPIRENVLKYYQMTKVLGKGGYGVVKEAKRLNRDLPVTFAIKSLNKRKLGDKIHRIRKEINIMASLDHPNIVKLHEVYEDQRYIHIVMERCHGGDLFDKIMQVEAYPEDKAQAIMKSLLSAVNYMHVHKIMHRDLKPENMLLINDESDTAIKIIDFGLSKYFNKNKPCNTYCGSLFYVAPELIKGGYD
jgi:calcium-dependent protein kinase